MSLFALDPDTWARIARDGTPAFAYDLGVARDAFAGLRKVLPDRVRLAYAVKANPHPALLRRFCVLGASFDCASAGEMMRLADMARDRLFFAGPGKRKEELDLALGLGARVQADGWEDLERLEGLAKGPVAVNLRVHPMGGIEEERSIIGGTGPSAFGVDEERLPTLLHRARSLRKVAIRGLHVFAASNERDASRLLATHARVMAIAKDLQDALGAPLDAPALGRGLGLLLEDNPWFRGELVLEPGRYLAASCGVYLTRVVRVKESRGVRFVILEGGVNHLLRPLLTGQPFPTRAVGIEGKGRPATLAGPLCTSLDRLGEVDLPEVGPGDLLAMGMAGAYGFTEAMTPFLSHPPPREVWEG